MNFPNLKNNPLSFREFSIRFYMSFFQRLQFSFFLFLRLPVAWWSGLVLESLNKQTAIVSIKYRWRTRNPFGSMYFACQAMAAEMASGILAFNAIKEEDGDYSMFVKNIEVQFTKKAVGKISFQCDDGLAIRDLLQNLQQPGDTNSLRCLSTGVDLSGETVSTFIVEWHFRKKK